MSRRSSSSAFGTSVGRQVLERLERRHEVERTGPERDPVQQVSVAHVSARAERGVVERGLADVDPFRIDAQLALRLDEEAERTADIERPRHRKPAPDQVGAHVGVGRATRVVGRADLERCRRGQAAVVVVAFVHVVTQRPIELARTDPDDAAEPGPTRRARVQPTTHRRREALTNAQDPSTRCSSSLGNVMRTGMETMPASTRRVHHRERVLLLAPVVHGALVGRLDRERHEVRAVEQRHPLEFEDDLAVAGRGRDVDVENPRVGAEQVVAGLVVERDAELQVIGRFVRVERHANRHRLVGEQPRATDEASRGAR